MSLINEANFFVVIIALIIIFFLLGLIIGNIIDRPKNISKDKRKTSKEAEREIPPLADTLGQDNLGNMNRQDSRQNQILNDSKQDQNPNDARQNQNQNDSRQKQNPNDSRNRYYNNYW